jgi:threonine dehydratase
MSSTGGVSSQVVSERIERAPRLIDPVFLGTPQYRSAGLSAIAGACVVLKVETLNPIRSFKGRGTSLLVATLKDRGIPLVCASAGNFGQGLAYAARSHGVEVHVWTASDANPFKLARMRQLGARVHVHDGDFDDAKEAGRLDAQQRDWHFVEDGVEAAIAEGAGTIALELGELDALVVPVGNGSLINGIGRWLRHRHPATRLIAAGAVGAPAMEIAWRTGAMDPAPADTIADGIAARVPVPQALELMRELVDDFWLVDDDGIVEAMRLVFEHEGLVVEPAGAAGLAALLAHREELAGLHVGVPLCGANVAPERAREWLLR